MTHFSYSWDFPYPTLSVTFSWAFVPVRVKVGLVQFAPENCSKSEISVLTVYIFLFFVNNLTCLCKQICPWRFLDWSLSVYGNRSGVLPSFTWLPQAFANHLISDRYASVVVVRAVKTRITKITLNISPSGKILNFFYGLFFEILLSLWSRAICIGDHPNM